MKNIIEHYLELPQEDNLETRLAIKISDYIKEHSQR